MDRRSWPWKKKSSEKGGNQRDQVGTKSVDYVQISAESYAHMNDLEDQVKVLREKLSAMESEMITKDNVVKQHAKVAEEAISGWEKAEAETSALKQHLESVTLLKLTVEDRASHLDGALRECMNLKEESERNLHDTIFTKGKQWEKVKLQLEAKIVDFEQEVQMIAAENDALSRSLQERSTLLMKISEEKSQADAQIEVLKIDIQACEREIASLKYEVHVVSKEIEIRHEQKNMSERSAGVANKQHIEDVKKITKLEAECHRLRGLLRKKLPGPAALAQMKLEVENFGRDYGEARLRRSSPRSSSPYLGSAPEFSLESFQQSHKENEFLTARLQAMEEEARILKEAFLKSNFELQASKNVCARTESKLQSIELQKPVLHQQKSPSKRYFDQNASNRSLTSMSEDGIDEEGSCSESWATVQISELTQFKKENMTNNDKPANSNHVELMDDFLEMERLACSSAETNRTTFVSDATSSVMQGELPQHLSSCLNEEAPTLNATCEISSKQVNNPCTDFEHTMDKDLKNVISQIHDFVLSLCKEATDIEIASSGDHGLREKVEEFSRFVNGVHNEINLNDYIRALSNILSETREPRFLKGNEGEFNSIDCVDKVTLLENKIAPSALEIFEGPTSPGFERKATLQKCSPEEFERMNETIQRTKLQLAEKEHHIAELESQLASCQKSNSLADTQLKCMTESYKSLESRTKVLESEMNGLRSKAEALDNELQEERRSHQDDLARYKDLQEHMERNVRCSTCTFHSKAEDGKTKQEREIEAAAEKLAQCQETIFLLGRQLNAFRPPSNPTASSPNDSLRLSDVCVEDEIFSTKHPDQYELENVASISHATGPNSHLNGYSSHLEASPIPRPPVSSKCQKHRSRSASSSSLQSMLGEKHERGFSRFFLKGRSDR